MFLWNVAAEEAEAAARRVGGIREVSSEEEGNGILRLRVTCDGSEADFGRPIFVTEDMSAVADVYERLKPREIKVTQRGTSAVRFEIPDRTGGVFTSLPYEDGWSVSGTRVYGALMFFDEVTVYRYAKNGVITMRFIPKGMAAGALVSLVSFMFKLCSFSIVWFLSLYV